MIRMLSRLIPLILLLTAPAWAADLRITDSTGVEIVVRDVSIDYGGLLGADKETEGIRVAQGEALVTAKWSDMVSLTITGRNANATPPQLTIEIVLKDGKKVNAMLQRKGRMKLAGTSDLGAYSIDLEKIKKLAPIAAR